VDAFTRTPFKGNPAAVCILQRPADTGWMQDVAREMNLSETAFLHREGDGFRLRWFTPAVEVALCGHATLASAHIMWEVGLLGATEQARFHTKSGLLTARRKGEWIEMDFPVDPVSASKPPKGLAEALGVTPKNVGKTRLYYLLEVESERTARELTPDFEAMKAATDHGVMVTSLSSSREFDFVSRFFAPAVGINEDPVTGSSHCCLGPYWGARLGKQEMVAYQASARGGIVRVRLGGERVYLGGQAVTVLRGELV
jgi:PhzF family phenazine biosynthesis protein